VLSTDPCTRIRGQAFSRAAAWRRVHPGSARTPDRESAAAARVPDAQQPFAEALPLTALNDALHAGMI
jgi:hypothetical protein